MTGNKLGSAPDASRAKAAREEGELDRRARRCSRETLQNIPSASNTPRDTIPHMAKVPKVHLCITGCGREVWKQKAGRGRPRMYCEACDTPERRRAYLRAYRKAYYHANSLASQRRQRRERERLAQEAERGLSGGT